MVRTILVGLVVFGSLLSPWQARADLFAIDLEVKTLKESKTAHAETAGADKKPPAPTVVEARTGERISVRWKLRNSAPQTKVPDLLVHFFAAKAEKIGQKNLPNLAKDVVVETALTMDFKPKDQAEGALSFQIDKPGFYLLRLETIGAATAANEQESFAVVDLKVR